VNDEGIIFKKAEERIFILCGQGTLRQGIWFGWKLQGIQQGLDAIVDISALRDDCTRRFGSKKKNLKFRHEMILSGDQRSKPEGLYRANEP
jgi:hypothetical protein